MYLEFGHHLCKYMNNSRNRLHYTFFIHLFILLGTGKQLLESQIHINMDAEGFDTYKIPRC